MYGLGVPSKAYNILASGKPILFIGPKDSEIYRLVKKNKLGWAFEWTEVVLISDLLNNLSLNDIWEVKQQSRTGFKIVQKFYDQKVQLQKYSNLFRKI